MSCVDEMAGIPMPPAPESDGPEADFDRIFEELDKDGSGTIDKDEMLGFIKKIA